MLRFHKKDFTYGECGGYWPLLQATTHGLLMEGKVGFKGYTQNRIGSWWVSPAHSIVWSPKQSSSPGLGSVDGMFSYTLHFIQL
jgi:hypothetical protein